MSQSLLGKNLVFLRMKNKWTQAEMQHHSGITGATWSNYENDVSKPSLEKILLISKMFGVTINDLLETDLENVHLNENLGKKTNAENVNLNVNPSVHLNPQNNLENDTVTQTKEPSVERVIMPRVIAVDTHGEENMIYVPVRAKAGYLTGYGDPEFISKLPIVHDPTFRNGTYRIFEVEGNSMFNTFHDRDKAVCRWESLANIVDNRVYVLVTQSQGIIIKRVISRLYEGKLICKSDNNHRGEYPPIIVDPHDVKEVWYVVEMRSRFLPEPGEIQHRIFNMEADIALLKDKLLKD